MADLDINLGFVTDEDSIRRIQKDITKAFNGVKPDINVQLPTGFFNSFRAELAKLTIPFNIDPTTITSSIQKLRDSFKFEISELDVSRDAIRILDKQIKDLGSKLIIQAKIEEEFGPKGGKRPGRGAISDELKSQASAEGLVIPGKGDKASKNLEVLSRQREKILTDIAEIEAERFLIVNNVNNALKQELSAIQQARDIENDIVNDRADLATAQKRLSALASAGGTPPGLEGNEDFTKQRALRLAAVETAQAQLVLGKERLAIFQRENTAAQTASDAARDLAEGQIKVKDAVRIYLRLQTQTNKAIRQQNNEIAGDSTLERVRALREHQLGFLKRVIEQTGLEANEIDRAVKAAEFTARQRKQGNDEVRKDLDAIRALRKIDEDLLAGRETTASAQKKRDKLIPTAPPTQLRVADPNNPASQISAISNNVRLALGQQLDGLQRSIDTTSQLATTTAEVNKLQSQERADILVLKDARALLSRGTISAANALKAGEQVAPASQTLSRERQGADFDPITAQLRSEANKELDALKQEAAIQQKKLEDIKASERAAADVAKATKEQVDILNRTNAISKRLEAGTRTTRQAQDAINKLREEPAASPQRLAEGNAREFNRLREQQLNAAQNDVNARIAGVEKLKALERVDDELFAAVIAEKNASLEARKIRQDLNSGLISIKDAQSQINRIQRRDPISSSVSDPAAASQLQAERDKELQATQNLVKLKEIQANDAKIVADDAKKLVSANEKNLQIRNELNRILNDEANNIGNSESIRRRLAGLEVNQLGTNARVLDQLILTNQNRINNAIALDEKDKEILAELNKHVSGQQEINKGLRRQSGLGKKQIDLQNDIAKKIQNELFESQQSGARNFPQQQRQVGPSDVLFRNAADVTQFTNSLNPQQLERFTQSLRTTSRTTNDAQNSVDKFGNSLKNGSDSSDKINKNVARGANLAQEFGRQVGQASIRLLAWAAPANLIFQTVTRLRSAVNEIINIDREARRLIFFRNVGSIVTQSTSAFNNNSQAIKDLDIALKSSQLNINGILSATSKLVATNADLSQEFRTTANIARQYGLSIGTVQDALVTVSRVGQQATSEFGNNASVFTSAALSLVRLERGALGATEAVRGLTAIQAQFFGGIRGGVFTVLADEATKAAIAVQLTSSAASILAVTSAGSSANVSELTDAATRLGSAFVNLQGLNFSQTIAILGEAFTATGATTGRLATALRQNATLIKQNAQEIFSLTSGAVNVIDERGAVKGFQAVLDILKEIKREGGSLKAVDLSLLIADRRNVADVAALAQNVEKLQAAFDRFSDPVQTVNREIAAQEVLFQQNASLAESLEGRITNLGTAFKTLIEGESVRSFLESIVSGFTKIIDGAGAVTATISNISASIPKAITGIGAIIGGLALGAITKGALDLGKGMGIAFSASAKLTKEIRAASVEISKEEGVLAGVVRLQQQGLITVEQQVVFLRERGIIQAQQGIQLAKILALETELATIDSTTLAGAAKKVTLEEELSIILTDIIVKKELLLNLEKDLTIEAGKQATQQTKGAASFGGLGRNIGGIAIIGATLASQAGVFSKDVESGLTGAILGGIAGAQLGSVGGPIGAIAGLMAGFFGKALKKQLELLAVDGGNILGKFSGEDRASPAFVEASEAAAAATQTAIKLDLIQASIAEKLKDATGEYAAQLRVNRDQIKAAKEQVVAIEELRLARANAASDPSAGPSQDEQNIEELNRMTFGLLGLADFLGIIPRKVDTITAEIKKKEDASLRAADVTAAAVVAATQGATDQIQAAKIQLELEKKITRIKDENAKITRQIAEGNLSTEQTVEALERRTANILFLQEEQSQLSPQLIKANREALVALEKQERALVRINRLADFEDSILKGLSSLNTNKDLQFSFDEAALDRATQRTKDIFKEQVSNIEILGRTTKEIQDDVAKQRLATESEVAKIQQTSFQNLISDQKRILDEANQKTLAQITAWEKASQTVTSAFEKVVSEQDSLARTFGDIGKLNEDRIKSSFSFISRFLEESGASVAARLALTAESANAQLGAVRGVANQQLSTVGNTFGSTAEVSTALGRLVDAVAAGAATADQKIFSEKSGVIREEIALTREKAAVERANFNLTIKNTKRAIEINSKLLNKEIEILNVRFEAEREFNSLRRNQIKEFGDLLLESPKEFKRELDNVKLAERFFKGITDLSEESLRTIRRRSQGQRVRGAAGEDVLKQIRDGLESAIKFGRPDVVSGVGNQQLRNVFSSVGDDQVSSIKDVVEKIKQQTDEANKELEIQKQIGIRQELLVNLAQRDSLLQQAQLQLAQIDANIAVQQRQAQIAKLEELKGIQVNLLDSSNAVKQAIQQLFGNNKVGSRAILEGLAAGGPFEKELAAFFDKVIVSQGAKNSGRFALGSKAFNDAMAVLVEASRAAADKENKEREKIVTEGDKIIDSQRKGRAELGKTLESIKNLGIAADELRASLKPAEQIENTLPKTIKGITSQLSNQLNTRPGSGNVSIGPSVELKELRKLQEDGGQLTRAERSRLNKLERKDTSFASSDTSGIAKRLFEENSQNIVGGFRNQLRDNVGIKDEFIDRARSLRGEGQRGRRDVNVFEVQKFFKNQGLAGAASKASSRGGAIEQLDKFIELSEALAKEQGNISKATQKKILEILSSELTPGIKQIINEAGSEITNRGNIVGKIFSDGFIEASSKLDGVALRLGEVGDKVGKSIDTAFAGNADKLSQGLSKGIEDGLTAGAQKIAENSIKVDPIDIKAEIAIRAPDALNAAQLTGLLTAGLGPLIGDTLKTKEIVKRLEIIAEELIRKGMANPVLSFEDVISGKFFPLTGAPPVIEP